MKKILTNKLFMSSFAADMLSNFGDVLYYLALMNYVLLLPSPQFALSIITFSETFPILTNFAVNIYADKTKNKLDTVLLTLGARCGLYILVGLLMGFTPSLWVVLIVSIINLLSDLLGQYENGLFTPISLRIVAKEERQQAQAFKMSTSSILSIVYQSLAAVLVGLMSYRNLAFFNAGTFAVAAIIMLLMKSDILKLLEKQPIQIADDTTEGQGNIFKEMWSSSKMVLREIKDIPVLKQALIIAPALNAIFSGLQVIVVYHLSQNKEMIIHNSATTIALASTCFLVGTILGGILVMGMAKDIDIIKILNLATIFPIFVFGSMLLHNTYLLLVFMFLLSILSGLINPKLQALIMNSLPEERLATIGAGIDTYFTGGMFVTRLIVAGLLLILTADQVTLLFVLLSILNLLYFLKGLAKKRQVKGASDVKS